LESKISEITTDTVVRAMIDALPPDHVKIYAERTPDAPAVVFENEILTYRELDRLATAYAAELRQSVAGPGFFVTFPARPDPATIVALVGVPRSGGTMVPSGPHPPHTTGQPVPREASAVVATSGSSGRPREVVFTSANIAASVAASQMRIGNDGGDRWLLCLPLWHVGGISVVWRSLAVGGSVLLHPGFDAEAVADDLRFGRATIASLVPTMLHRILENHPGSYDGVEAVLLGGAPAGTELVERALDAGLPVRQTYGMTEACSQVATVAAGEQRDALGTAGRPLDGFEVTIVDERGVTVPPGVVGEIAVAGPAVSSGYLGEEPRRGPHHTGDLGRFDGDGRLVVVGRRDDVIITGGENVYATAVASAMMGLSGVRRCEVFGVPDDDWGEVVVAVVEVDDPTRTDLDTKARERLEPHQVPKRWLLLEDMPLLDNGKVDRAALRSSL
jgi:O-succinylbenzoic acid--CoA ligase